MQTRFRAENGPGKRNSERAARGEAHLSLTALLRVVVIASKDGTPSL